MFGRRYFGPRYFGGRYFGHAGFGHARVAVVGKPGAGKLKLPYFEPAWPGLKPQNVRILVSHVSLFVSIRSTVSIERSIRSRVAFPFEAKSAQSVWREARSFAGLGFRPRASAIVACSAAVRSSASIGVRAGCSVVGSIRRESRATLSFSASSQQRWTAAHRSAVPLFASARSHFANKQNAVVSSRATLVGSIRSSVECATKVSRVAEMDRRDIDLILLLAA